MTHTNNFKMGPFQCTNSDLVKKHPNSFLAFDVGWIILGEAKKHFNIIPGLIHFQSNSLHKTEGK